MIIQSHLLESARRLFSYSFTPTVTRYSLPEIEAVFAEAYELQQQETELRAQIDDDYDYILGGTDKQYNNLQAVNKIYGTGEVVIEQTRRSTPEMFPVAKWQKELARQRRINANLAKLASK